MQIRKKLFLWNLGIKINKRADQRWFIFNLLKKMGSKHDS